MKHTYSSIVRHSTPPNCHFIDPLCPINYVIWSWSLLWFIFYFSLISIQQQRLILSVFMTFPLCEEKALDCYLCDWSYSTIVAFTVQASKKVRATHAIRFICVYIYVYLLSFGLYRFHKRQINWKRIEPHSVHFYFEIETSFIAVNDGI